MKMTRQGIDNTKKGESLSKEAEKTMNNKMEMNCRHAKEERKLMIPKGQFHSDWFECSKCGYEVRVLTLSNQIKCSECGGTMYRK